MREVTVITDLVTEKRPYYGEDELRWMSPIRAHMTYVGDGAIPYGDAAVHTELLPIMQLFTQVDRDRPPVEKYLAYTPQVEKLLEIPINTVYREMRDAQAASARHQLALAALMGRVDAARGSLWGRLRFLFTGELR